MIFLKKLLLNKSWMLTIFIFTSLLITETIGAQTQPSITLKPVVGFSTLSQAINTLLTLAIFGGALACFIYLILGAFKYVTAQDDPSKTAAARQTIINAVVGLILLALIVVIFQIVVAIVPGLDQWFHSGDSNYYPDCTGLSQDC